MKTFLCLLVVTSLCQSLSGTVSANSDHEKPTGGILMHGELPKKGILHDKVRTDTSSQINTTRVRIEELPHQTTSKTSESPAEPQTEAEPEAEPEAIPEAEHQADPDAEPEDEPEAELEPESKSEPEAELIVITDRTFLPCSFIPCPFVKKTEKNPRFRPMKPKNSTSKSQEDELTPYETELLYEFYRSLLLQLLLVTLFSLTVVLLLSFLILTLYISKNGLNLRRFRKLENHDCGLNKFNF